MNIAYGHFGMDHAREIGRNIRVRAEPSVL